MVYSLMGMGDPFGVLACFYALAQARQINKNLQNFRLVNQCLFLLDDSGFLWLQSWIQNIVSYLFFSPFISSVFSVCLGCRKLNQWQCHWLSHFYFSPDCCFHLALEKKPTDGVLCIVILSSEYMSCALLLLVQPEVFSCSLWVWMHW